MPKWEEELRRVTRREARARGLTGKRARAYEWGPVWTVRRAKAEYRRSKRKGR